MKMAMKLGLLVIFFGLALTVNSQTSAPDSIVQLTADSQGLQLMAPDELPPSGTFWLIESCGVSVPGVVPD